MEKKREKEIRKGKQLDIKKNRVKKRRTVNKREMCIMRRMTGLRMWG